MYMFDLKSWSEKLNITISNAEVSGKLIKDKLISYEREVYNIVAFTHAWYE